MVSINYTSIKIIKSYNQIEAESRVNDFLEQCRQDGKKILEVTDHVTVDVDDYYSYTFIFKIK